jgi:predicted nucleic acid-binding protein
VQEKVVFDTNVYIDLFNHGYHREEIDGFRKVMYLAHPVLHELWIGARGPAEVKHLTAFTRGFIRLGRLITPVPATQRLIGEVCRRLRRAGLLDPKCPRGYNDVCIAMLARQIGAVVVTRDENDFAAICSQVDFSFRAVRGTH